MKESVRLKKLALIDKQIEAEEAIIRANVDADPFKYFVPNDGVLTDARKAILRRYLKEEDIPVKVDSQLDVLLSKAEIRGVSGGNRSSKTMTETMLGIIKSTGELPESLKKYEEHFRSFLKRAHNKFVNGRVTGVDNKQLHRVVLPEWKKWIPRQYLKKGDWDASYSKEFDILTLYRNNKPCSNVEFLTNEQKVKSAQGGNLDWANFDEEPEKAKYKETLMRFGTSDRLDIGIAWTPTEGLTWATDLFHHGIFTDDYGDESEVKSNVELFKLTSVCNRFVQDTIMQIMDNYKQVSSYDEMKMRLLGEAISLSGLVYGAVFNRHIHVVPEFWSALSPSKKYNDYIVFRGLDPHMVKPSVAVEVAIDRENREYVVGTYIKEADVEVIKKDLALRAIERNYRLGWSRCDRSADSTIKALGDRNIYLELGQGQNAIPALEKSEKFTGSIHRGVDTIKQKLSNKELFIEDIPENRILINAMQTIERETYTNEDKKGLKDQIAEGKHDTHAALRYCHQRIMNWMEPFQGVPEPDVINDAIGW